MFDVILMVEWLYKPSFSSLWNYIKQSSVSNFDVFEISWIFELRLLKQVKKMILYAIKSAVSTLDPNSRFFLRTFGPLHVVELIYLLWLVKMHYMILFDKLIFPLSSRLKFSDFLLSFGLKILDLKQAFSNLFLWGLLF